MADTLAHQKARGAFFTPPPVSRFITNWAIRSSTDTVLEPSCGEASFLVPAAERLSALSGNGFSPRQLLGIEVHAASAQAASELLATNGFSAKVEAADFFDVTPEPIYDAVIGNPPYVRYQNFSGDTRSKSLRAALTQGVRLTRLASSWAAFVVQSTRFLKPSGRLGLVLPAELLSVSYAAPVRRFLLERFGKVRLVMFEELIFPGVLEEVVLLLAEGQGPAPHFELHQLRNFDELDDVDRAVSTWFSPQGDDKWTPALLPVGAFDAYVPLCQSDEITRLLEWGETYLGAVTGKNDYFAVTFATAREHRLRKRDLLPISPPGSRHLRGLTFTEKAWQKGGKDGARCYMFSPRTANLSPTAERYVELGRKAGVHRAYKCRVRTPWWQVPTVPIPDLLLTYMDHERPRLTTNAGKLYHLNSLYGVALRQGYQTLGRDLLPLACLNSLTILGAEIVGRSYGGGLLKLEPTEADALPVPGKTLLKEASKELRAVRPQLSKALRQNDILEASKLVDRVLLVRHLGLTQSQVNSLREARHFLFARRASRGKGKRGKN